MFKSVTFLHRFPDFYLIATRIPPGQGRLVGGFGLVGGLVGRLVGGWVGGWLGYVGVQLGPF